MKKFLFYLLLLLLVIQVIRPSKNISDKIAEAAVNTPENIQKILNRSCNDCHSNNTKYEWYHSVAPISFFVSSHVNDGKEHVNFDEWKSYNKDQKKHIIKDLKESIETRKMPLIGYLKFHPEAFLSEEENQELLDWINTLENN